MTWITGLIIVWRVASLTLRRRVPDNHWHDTMRNPHSDALRSEGNLMSGDRTIPDYPLLGDTPNKRNFHNNIRPHHYAVDSLQDWRGMLYRYR